MTSLAFMECCQRLAVTPKTLRQWLTQAEISLHPHPTDARITCLTSDQLQQLATLHGRVLHPSGNLLIGSELGCGETIDADLRRRVAQIEAHIATLQTQLTDLTLLLLREREQRTKEPLHALEAQVSQAGEALPPLSARSVSFTQAESSVARRAPRQRTRLIPLIEYGAAGQYILMCPKEGERHILPDSPEWFAWLATFNSFRFIGRQGRLSASRTKGRPCWMAYRRIHGHCYAYGLGNTKRLTIAHLEHMAATLQAHDPSPN